MNATQCWEAVSKRDGNLDGAFYFGVLTTGVYCRPSCGARRPRRENVRFYETPAAAERDGLRACLRCRPLDLELEGKKLEEVRAGLEAGDAVGDLAARAGWSASYLAKRFRAAFGCGPAAYRKAAKMRELKTQLRGGNNVTDAVYAAGLGSPSRAYENAAAALGMTPGEYLAGAAGMMVRWCSLETPVGEMIVGATGRGVCYAAFGGTLAELAAEFPKAEFVEEAGMREARKLAAMIAGGEGDLPLVVMGTEFQRRVWEYLRTVPRGQTRTYSEVAAGIGKPKAVRAVASACAANRIAVAIPCHRVVPAAGGAGQYRWGAERKKKLLESERG